MISEERYCLDKAKCFASEGRRAFLKKRSPKFKSASCNILVADIGRFRSLLPLPTIACQVPGAPLPSMVAGIKLAAGAGPS